VLSNTDARPLALIRHWMGHFLVIERRRVLLFLLVVSINSFLSFQGGNEIGVYRDVSYGKSKVYMEMEPPQKLCAKIVS
jgi:hypothetical protein